MAKLIKGDNVQNIITDGDVLVTSPSQIGKTLCDVLNEQQSDINKLKSNVKYIYAYGGVGGSGSGGSGTTEKPVTVFITLGDFAVTNGGDDIVLDGKGKYKLYIKLNNAGEKTYYMGYSTTGGVTDNMLKYKLNGDNKYKQDIDIELNSNGTLVVKIIDSEENVIGYYSQKYIVESETFNVTLNYIDINGVSRPYSVEPYECFVTDSYRSNRYLKIDYSINLLNYSEVNIKCQIDGGVGVIYEGSDSVEIPIEGDNCGVNINGEPILQNKFMGTYTLKATLSYKISGKEIVRERTLMFSVVPSGLYINVRTVGDVLYDDINLLNEDILNGVDGIPYKCITQGSSLMMYCKVYEGSMEGNAFKYVTTVKAYDSILDEDGNIIGWNDMGITEGETLTEQVESSKGVSVTFPSGGIKKITISTKGAKGDNTNITKDFDKYVFVKNFKEECDWFNTDIYGVLGDSYFKANQGDDTYKSFPQLSSGNGVLSLTKSAKPIVIDQSEIDTPKDSVLCTVISLGIQVSNINSENASILDIYTTSSESLPTYSLKINSLFSDDGTNKIAIPTEILNKNDNSKYHLIQIVRNLAGFKDGVEAIYEDSLYIDGMLESSSASTTSWALKVTQFILQNINICYNLINVQYFSYSHKVNDEIIKFNPDGYAYQYWLAYKEKYVNSSLDSGRLTEEELFIKENMDRIYFDGTNVVVDPSIIMDIASRSDLPTVVFSYNCENGDDKKKISEFMELMWMGRQNGDDTFNSRKIDLYWIPERSVGKLEDYKIMIPSNFTDNTYEQVITGNWEIDLQGTSTMRNRIKNYSLRINSQSASGKDKILFSPKFDIKDSKTFLPDVEWTIKADIADSAHANNTSIGKFVNAVCTKIDTNIPDISFEPDAKQFIKNTLEGIPVLMYFMCEGLDDNGNNSIKTYYFGIYNFNLGRNSYYNLGYNGGIVDEQEKRSDFIRVFKNIKNNESSKYYQDNIFTFAVGECALSPNIAIGEIQENSPQFDFHQFDPTLLFKDEENDNNCMFGSKKKVTAPDFAKAKIALGNLVKGVAKAGKYCFDQSGRKKDFVTSRQFDYDENNEPVYGQVCVNRYTEGLIPDPIFQIQYENNKLKWVENHECDNVDISDLKKLIIEFEDTDGNFNKPLLNYKSASEYYTICMAFGMVDSVLKNMNLKNFRSLDEGPNFYCAFYDMDCALEEGNDGAEKITYLAATDYWYSPMDSKNKVGEIEKKNDYWEDSVGSGFDFTSSYLFAVVKYAKSIFDALPETEEKFEEDLDNYPQRFWAKLRKYDGELQSADYFIENYFKSGITTTFEYLASLNYRVKYLYHGYVYDDKGNYTEKYLANGIAFNGSRRIKAKNWLSKRLRFLDLMMNVNNLTIPVSDESMLTIPKPGENYKSDLMKNNDITILHSAFNSEEANTALSNFKGEVAIYAPAYTPFIFMKGASSIQMYLLTGGIEKPNLIYITTTEAEGTRFYGSGLFTSVNKVESMFTSYNSIVSDNLESIEYGNTPVRGNSGRGLFVNAKSVREINLNIPKMGGKLDIHQDCISLEKINIADSEFYGTFEQLPNLQEVNISGVKSSQIYISKDANGEYLNGGRIHISGKGDESKTTLDTLDITGVTGNFRCEYTDIEDLRIRNTTKTDDSDFDPDLLSELFISGDRRLKKLHLEGFKKVHIESCNKLSELSIDDSLEEIYINLSKIDKNETTSALNKIYLGTDVEEGVFDFTNYPNLKKVTLMNCDKLVHVKLPNHDIETEGMCDNANLKWIDTGLLPAFRDDKAYDGIGDYEGIKFQTYPNSPKLILLSKAAFRNCPNYAMLRSDWDKGEVMIGNKYYIAYTNITVSEYCTDLSDTFFVNRSESDDKFDMNTAIRFIQKCVPNKVKENITSLSGCFRGRSGVKYTMSDAAAEKPYENTSDYGGGLNKHPILSDYKSLNNISSMYYGTGVNFISKNLLDLPSDQNVPGNTLNWYSLIQTMTKMNISSDALYNISYRLDNYSNITFIIYEYNKEKSSYVSVGSEDKKFNVCDLFYPFDDGKKIYTEENGCEFSDDLVPYEHINEISALNFGDQYLDFRGMFNLFPNVRSLSLFLYGCNLSNYNIDGLLRPCKNITSISQSFCDININESTQEIDLYNFFNWEENTTEVTGLFEGPSKNYSENGFVVKKTVDYDNFKKILEKISDYKLTRLTNIFSYCKITGYNNEEIVLPKPLNNVNNISNLFNGCTSDYIPYADEPDGIKGIYKGGVLNIGRSFFKNLPGVTIVTRTFMNTYLSSSLTYDFFCKRDESIIETKVLLSTDKSDEATLYEYTYNSNMITLNECFYNTKFVSCKNWFDKNDEGNINIERNYIISKDGVRHDEVGFEYYIYSNISGTYDKYTLDNYAIDDCLDNYTDFVPQNSISNKTDGPVIWYNHDLLQDFIYYGNITGGIKPFDPENKACVNTIQKTYCCLPPDFFYGCSETATINSIFANSNIIGVIPRNLTKKIRNKHIPNVFLNVNIMPNLEYYYDENGSLNDSILNNIELPDEIEGNPEEYTVVFRDDYGRLQRRKPVDGDRNLGQFVYVPNNYTTSGNLMNMFNFRYNLPRHWEMPGKPEGHVGYYKTTEEFNDAISNGEINISYRSQYYFITDKCVDWSALYDARSIFITSYQDIDFSNKNIMGNSRGLYDIDDETSIEQKNSWSKNDNRVISAYSWTNNIIERFYIDLNLCGKKNEHNMIEDYGCPIVVKNKGVLLDNFISDVLTTFLNGRVFSSDFEIGDLTTSNHKTGASSYIISYNGYGKNIILPKFHVSLSDDEFEFMPVDKDFIYYDFMLNGDELSKENYNTNLVRGRRDTDLFETNYNKYTFK